MIPAVVEQADELKRLCRRYRVQRLDLFGSAATGAYCPEDSDLDFVVEFQPEAFAAYADTYFGLLEALEKIFGSPVDFGGRLCNRKPLLPAISRADEDAHL